MGRKRTRKRASKSTDSGESVSESQAKNQSERSTRSSGSHGPLTGTAAVDQGIGDDINALTGQPEGFNAMAGSNTPDFEPLPTGPDAQIQRALEGTGTTRNEVPDAVLDVLGQGGKPLEQPIQRTLEERMDADFSNVRIHTGGKAAQAADAIDAKAFTCGNDIVFNAGEYDPESGEGQFLLAHELAHVRQQTGAAISMMPQEGAALEIDPDQQLEREADETASDTLSRDNPLVVNRMGSDVHIQRVEQDETIGFGQLQPELPTVSQQELTDKEQKTITKFLSLKELSDSELETIAEVFQIGSTDKIRAASDRITWIHTNHDRLSRIVPGWSANDEERYPDWYEDPHDPDSLVLEFNTSATEDTVMLRAHGEENQNQYWLIPPKEIGGVDPNDVEGLTAADIQEALALPEKPKYISKVTLPPETPIRVSGIKENFGSDGEWTQAEIENRLGEDAYEVIRTFEEVATDRGDNE
ncbi:hypothetical protein C483_02670 [Natrialba hulunbeirensis JCM 10989]|uniref:eCIS core domain-containing protein n=1 Tax=Natrialba hulunbeirensis JCM 10989 TaxID=1227493 RepID=M0A7U2_9EURY|nr:DUF4157 domain-containing protein [Natrialba hulunbeirensis]ELY94599.1 hypothetical protein C483_02670 [Natrialba hulunbeirensis JCM 10989]